MKPSSGAVAIVVARSKFWEETLYLRTPKKETAYELLHWRKQQETRTRSMHRCSASEVVCSSAGRRDRGVDRRLIPILLSSFGHLDTFSSFLRPGEAPFPTRQPREPRRSVAYRDGRGRPYCNILCENATGKLACLGDPSPS